MKVLFTLSFLWVAGFSWAGNMFLENVDEYGRQYIAVSLNGDAIAGTLTQEAESGNAYGTFVGEKSEDGIFKAQYAFEVDGSQLTEEILFKIEKGRLLMAVGELTESSPGNLVIKDPSKALFSKVFKPLPVTQTDPSTPEGSAVVDALQEPVSKNVGVPILLNAGSIVISGDWALYDGVVSPVDPAKTLDSGLTEKLAHGRFRGFVQRDVGGPWKVVRFAFMSDAGEFPYAEGGDEAPWQLVAAITLPGTLGDN